eukprot:scaffold279628_cov15-Tisochrysis_lutea.AAC.1
MMQLVFHAKVGSLHYKATELVVVLAHEGKHIKRLCKMNGRQVRSRLGRRVEEWKERARGSILQPKRSYLGSVDTKEKRSVALPESHCIYPGATVQEAASYATNSSSSSITTTSFP